MDAIERDSGPIYGVKLIDSLPIGKGGMLQAMPNRKDLEKVQRISVRTVAGFEVLTEHYRDAIAALSKIDESRSLPSCGCKLARKMAGDGCEVCNPKLADELRESVLREALMKVVGAAYLPCDQTIMCNCCGATWWSQREDINENWHADGCCVFAAEVMLRLSVDVRRDPVPEKRNPWDWCGDSTVLKSRAKAVREEIEHLRSR